MEIGLRTEDLDFAGEELPEEDGELDIFLNALGLAKTGRKLVGVAAQDAPGFVALGASGKVLEGGLAGSIGSRGAMRGEPMGFAFGAEHAGCVGVPDGGGTVGEAVGQRAEPIVVGDGLEGFEESLSLNGASAAPAGKLIVQAFADIGPAPRFSVAAQARRSWWPVKSESRRVTSTRNALSSGRLSVVRTARKWLPPLEPSNSGANPKRRRSARGIAG